MPKSKSAKKVLAKFKKKYGDEEGERIYYATAKKQNRDTDTFHKESFHLLEDILLEENGAIIVIAQGTQFDDFTSYIPALIDNGIAAELDEDTGSMVALDTEHNQQHYPDLVGKDITNLMQVVSSVVANVGGQTLYQDIDEAYKSPFGPSGFSMKGVLSRGDRVRILQGPHEGNAGVIVGFADDGRRLPIINIDGHGTEDIKASYLEKIIGETVGMGAIAMVPNALGDKPKKKKKKKGYKEASNSQISRLNLDH